MTCFVNFVNQEIDFHSVVQKRDFSNFVYLSMSNNKTNDWHCGKPKNDISPTNDAPKFFVFIFAFKIIKNGKISFPIYKPKVISNGKDYSIN